MPDRQASLNAGLAARNKELMRVEAEDFHWVMVAARSFEGNLYRELRKRLRLAGEDTAAAVRAEIDQIPASGRHHRGLRAALKRGTRVAISTGGESGRGAGVRITTRATGFPAKAMNLPDGKLRHPVYARSNYTLKMADDYAKATGANKRKTRDAARKSWKWVEQPSRPYFGAVILKHQRGLREAVLRALDDAAKQMAADVESH